WVCNVLCIARWVLLLDDVFWLRWLPANLRSFVSERLKFRAEPDSHSAESRSGPANAAANPPGAESPLPNPPVSFPSSEKRGLGLWTTVRTIGVVVLAAFVLLVSGAETAARMFGGRNLPRPLLELLQWISPLRTINSYGLFAVMTTSRPE